MKKYISIVVLFSLISILSQAQVQRTPAKQKTDSAAVVTDTVKDKKSKKEILKELDLSREQKVKLKELNQSMKASKEALENDTTLTEADKKAKLKVLKKEQAQKIQALLTEEQKIKFRKLRNKNGNE